MRGLRNLGNAKVALVDDLPDPKPGRGQVLVRIKASAICGSELGAFRGPEPMATNTGHESMGIVVDARGSTKVKEGQRVGVSTLVGCGKCRWCAQGKPAFCPKVGVARPTHNEYIAAYERWLMPLPDDIEDVEGVLVAGDGLGVPWGAAKRGGVKAGDITCVLGCGPVGLGSIIVHRYLGARVIAVDINPNRIKLARKMGAWKTIDASKCKDLGEALLDLTAGMGPDVCLEACGKQPTLDAAVKATKPEGTVVLCGHGPQTLDPQKLIIQRNLRLVGNWMCHFYEWTEMVEAIRRGLRARDAVTGRYPLEEAQTAYDRFMKGLEGKVVFVQ
jgi:propanol-preferring alcohol dehydrogenase